MPGQEIGKNTATIFATGDIDTSTLRELESSVALINPVKLDERRILLLSVEPPSWISLIAQADWWVQGFAAYAALYVAEIVKESAKASWNSRGRVFSALVGTTNKLSQLATSLVKARLQSSPSTYFSVGLPIPDEIYTTLLRIESKDADNVAIEISLFVQHIPELIKLLYVERIPEGSAVGRINVKVLDDGSLDVRWMDKVTLREITRLIPLKQYHAAQPTGAETDASSVK